MQIRKATEEDRDALMDLYAHARDFMAANGNPHQWGDRRWPPRELIAADIAAGKSYICHEQGRLLAAFYFDAGNCPEPGYDVLEAAWLAEGPYGVVHRIAAAENGRGAGTFCLEWAYSRCGHLRADTHADNTVMQNLLQKLGFVRCGTVLADDGTPRLAYEKAPGLCRCDACV